METIYALSSGAVPAGVAVIRISGPLASVALENLTGAVPPPRQARLSAFRRPDRSVIDQGLVIWFPAPASFTGEDVAEFHAHGGRAVIGALFDAIEALGGRMASPGEFARRAFGNGKLDLTQAEGLVDLIGAETEAQLRQAVGAARGALATKAEAWRGRLIDLRAEIESRLDFSDEGDVPDALPTSFWDEIAELRADMASALETAAGGERVREGFRIAILGRPNAGKSTLLNALAQRDVAIVTTEPGTTRDVLEVPLDLGGYPIVLFDTAGLRDAASAAEREGVRRAEAAAVKADLVLWLEDAATEPEEMPLDATTAVWRVRTKSDLYPAKRRDSLAVSALTGDGLEELIDRIMALASGSMGRELALVTRRRQRVAIEAAVASLQGIDQTPPEITADLLRSASDAIGRLTGRVGIEDVLDRLFAEFCIGK